MQVPVKWFDAIFLIAAFFWAVACNAPVDKRKDSPYYPVGDFFNDEINRHISRHTVISKQINLNGRVDSSIMENVNWEEELFPFKNCDINKPAMFGKYSGDTVVQQQGGFLLKYIAEDTTLQIRTIAISFDSSGKIKRVDILRKQQNFFYRTKQELSYDPDSGYRISVFQKVIFLAPDRYTIASQFLRK